MEERTTELSIRLMNMENTKATIQTKRTRLMRPGGRRQDPDRTADGHEVEWFVNCELVSNGRHYLSRSWLQRFRSKVTFSDSPDYLFCCVS
jgi:hypothetical protein